MARKAPTLSLMRTCLTDTALDSSASCSVTGSVVELMAIDNVNGMEKG